MNSQNINIHPFLNPLQLGGRLCLPSRIIPGPMEGLLTAVYCKTLADMNLVDSWITPFIRISTAVPAANKFLKKIKPFLDTNLPVTVQLMGNDAELMGLSAECLTNINIHSININFACPSRTVKKSGSGGALLSDLPKLLNIILAIRIKCPKISLSVKIRSGFANSAEMFKIIPAIVDTGIDFIIFHFRTVLEEYSIVSKGIERHIKAKELAGAIPLIASGDIFSINDAKEILEKTNCDGLIAARGLLKNPFIIKDIKTFIQNDIYSEDSAKRKIIFFNNMLKNALENPKIFWRKAHFLEIARYLFGEQSTYFKKIVKEFYSFDKMLTAIIDKG